MKKVLTHHCTPWQTRLHFTLPFRVISTLTLLGLLAGLGFFASRPAHSVGGPIAVSVANVPLPTSDVTLSGRTPFSKRLDLTFSNGLAKGTFTVPAGKRLVLTYVSADAGITVGAHILTDLATFYGGQEVEAHFPAISQGILFGQEVFAVSAPVTVYADPGSTVTFAVFDSDSTGFGGLIVGLYGYLENAS